MVSDKVCSVFRMRVLLSCKKIPMRLCKIFL
nr:MAG TPA: hypothetical protein [Caudoviricetes sp.]